MSYQVYLTQDAYNDLKDIYDYIEEHDSPNSAEYVLNNSENKFNNLSESPERGNYPAELKILGIREYRQVLFKPYRIIYRIIARRVYIYAIVDGRRDLHELLNRRLLKF